MMYVEFMKNFRLAYSSELMESFLLADWIELIAVRLILAS